jgi:protein-S-isoprenylcysteine O-methyltransferase Ste14
VDFAGSPLTRVLFYATIVVWVSLELRQSLTRRPGATKTDGGSFLLLRISYPLGVFLAIVVAKRHGLRIHPHLGATWLGLVLLWCGASLRLWSFKTLGKYFTFTVQTSDDQTIIDTGPYRVLRHPGYAGILLAITGIGFLFDNWGSLLVLLVFLTLPLIYRIRVEERALSRDLSGNYQAYAAGRKRLIPFIW